MHILIIGIHIHSKIVFILKWAPCAWLILLAWWRHQMETFSALLTICAGNSPVPGELPAQRPVTRSFDVFFDLRLNKRLSKQSWGWWFETLSCPLWRQCNGVEVGHVGIKTLPHRYRDSDYKDETVVRPSYLYNGRSYTDIKAAHLYQTDRCAFLARTFHQKSKVSKTMLTLYLDINLHYMMWKLYIYILLIVLSVLGAVS